MISYSLSYLNLFSKVKSKTKQGKQKILGKLS